MNIDGEDINNWSGTLFKHLVYEKLILLHGGMKKVKIDSKRDPKKGPA